MDNIRTAFKNYFAQFGLELPAEIEPRGKFYARGWAITYVQTQDDQGQPCLDFLAEHRMTNSRHERIHQDGTIKHLPAPLDAFVHDPNIPGDEARARRDFYEYNQQVEAILKAKGLR